MTGPVFEMPAAPMGRGYSSAHLIRIVDPRGDAVAWFAPAIGACCAGFAVRQVEGASPSQRVWWREIITASAVTRFSPSSPIGKDDGNPEPTWRFVERDPASCTLEWNDDEGSQAEHWRMVASLADAQLSLSLRMWTTGAAAFPVTARLKLALPSTPDVTIRTARPRRTNDPWEDRGNKNRREHHDDEVMIAVEAAPGTSTVQTEDLGGEITCAITYHPLDDPLPDLQTSRYQRLSVLIGLQASGGGAEW